jgi:hypothetical protein
MSHRVLATVLALATGVGVGVACGGNATRPSALPRAGSPSDDGTGFMARMSRGQHPRVRGGDDGSGEEDVYEEDESYAGEWYGGGAYGGGVYGVGGTIYPPATAAPAPVAGGYMIDSIVENGRGGSIEGVVSWKGARPPASLPAVASAVRCSGALENASLRVSAQGGLRDAVVYLVDIKSGKAPPPALGGTLEIGACRFAPLVQLAMPIGQVLAITNRDDTAAQVRMTRRATTMAGPPGEAVTDVELGARGEADVLLDRDAAFETSLTGGHPAAAAWVVVPPHPYYVLTDEQGRFRLDDVPPGEYTLAVWHPPVVTGVSAAGVVQRSPSHETRTHVRVEAMKPTAVRLELR